jgi:hypothetical protein
VEIAAEFSYTRDGLPVFSGQEQIEPLFGGEMA